MSDLVSAFNSLPRSPQTVDKISNDWVFTIRHVPVSPEADLIMLVNPISLESHCEGPIDLSKLTPHDVNAVVADCLLKAFVSGMGSDDKQRKVAPWTWKTTEGKLAQEVGVVLKMMNVREELGNVGVVDIEVKKIVDTQWDDLLGTIQRSMA
ncbi:hypothetical protein D9615_009874 [Tricholomella constricta]|uniref:Uncharacterized protein n=1 Tax=Tricholomella constricta TaxID=117010 RepID=A0A8H5GX74_9AGAR|nr:hypothetical protein D9615_009874 [Tricholomella constricta]